MGIEPIAKRSVSEEILKQIKQNIITGEWPAGSKIPGELKLARMFNVSRVSVRHAIQILVGMGILTVRRGDGTYVCDVAHLWQFDNILPMMILNKSYLLAIFEVRRVIEAENARLAAERATVKEIDDLRRLLSDMKDNKDDIEKYSEDDINFHMYIAEAAHNPVITKITSVIHEILQRTMREAVVVVGMDTGIYHHSKILEAIENRDSDKAAERMREHIDNAVKKVNELSIG